MALPVTMDGLTELTDLYLQNNLLSCLPDTAGEGEGGGLMSGEGGGLMSGVGRGVDVRGGRGG